ncbi:Protoheme IX farnesyltransferase, mitochondrial [Apostasia shenzhenica]|uniref:Heme O synthase n=1 Tax=Apostasia shenzhenica TaxID=1088818 RepID=A0A2H9ZR57_9ASPA|nr:Protoheme IX farnesyltransferase, mitochondrial [Apostasia shenzhenica]
MRRSTAACGLKLLSSGRASPRLERVPICCFGRASTSFFPFSFSGVGLVWTDSCLLQSSRLYTTDPWKVGLGRLSCGRQAHIGSAATTSSSGEEAVVLGSLASATSVIFQKAGGVSEVLSHYGRCYWELSKARLSLLVVATSGAGYVLGSGNALDCIGLCCTCFGTMMVAASANTLNQVFEVQNDAKMKRTRQRPLPSGRVSVGHAATWASIMGTAGTSLLYWKTNYLAAGLGAGNLFLYAFVYTPLKQIHPANTWVGAVVGAIPPLLGWAAASGEVSLSSMLLPGALYFWQIPHFMALAYLCRSDYVAGGFRMFTFVDISGWRTAWVSFRNCLYLLPVGYLAYDWGITSKWFAFESSILTLFLSAAALTFVRERTAKNARRMFRASLLYLPIFMSGMLLHRLPRTEPETLLFESSIEREVLVNDDEEHVHASCRIEVARPPVAYASVAPFPFLPAPLYSSSSSCVA